MISAPKYSKIEIKLERGGTPKLTSTEVLTFLDAGLVLTGDYLIVIIDEGNGINSNLTTTGEIFPLSQVKAYRTYSN
jgi:hypothetical protein